MSRALDEEAHIGEYRKHPMRSRNLENGMMTASLRAQCDAIGAVDAWFLQAGWTGSVQRIRSEVIDLATATLAR